MGAELGATTSIFPADEHMAKYLRATGKEGLVPLMQQNQHLLEPDKEVEADPAKFYDRVVELDLSKLEPYVVGPHSPDRARPISKLAAEVADPKNDFIDEISTALIGSCTNSSYEDMSRAADVAEQAKAHGLKAAVPFLVTPGSEQVRATIERDGQMQSLKDIDGTVLANACGPCIGQWRQVRRGGCDAEHHRHLVQPEFPAPQRRVADDDELHRQPRDRHRLCVGETAVVQPVDRHADGRRKASRSGSSRHSPRPKCRRTVSTPGWPPTSRRRRTAARSNWRSTRTASGCN